MHESRLRIGRCKSVAPTTEQALDDARREIGRLRALVDGAIDGPAILGPLLAHEINNLLTPAQVRLRTLASWSDPAVREAAEFVRQAIRHASEISRAVLDLHGATGHCHRSHVSTMVQSALAISGAHPRVRGNANMHVAAPEPLVVHWLVNVLLNARRACPRGRLTVAWRMSDPAKSRATWHSLEDHQPMAARLACIRVTDRGTGYVPGRVEGRGLGLLLCRLVARRCRGMMRVRNRGGTSMELWLPAAD